MHPLPLATNATMLAVAKLELYRWPWRDAWSRGNRAVERAQADPGNP